MTSSAGSVANVPAKSTRKSKKSAANRPAAENATPPAPPAPSRETIIRESLQTMFDARRRWANSTDNFFPDWLEDAISATLNIVMNGDVPESCIRIHTAIVRLADAWMKVVEEGEGIDSNGIPGINFWSLFEAVEDATKKVDQKQNRRLRPVKELLEEYKGDLRKHSYIAKDYGWLDTTGDEPIWKGPFFKNGNVDVLAIDREAANPGSVVPPDWHPEDENDRLKKQIISDSGSALARVRNHLRSKGKLQGESTEDTHEPKSIEELLRDGQFVANIAKFKNVSEHEVRQVAKKIGVRAMTKEDAFALAQMEDENPEDKIYRESMIGSDESRQEKYDRQRVADDEMGDDLGDDDSQDDSDDESGHDESTDAPSLSAEEEGGSGEESPGEESVDSLLEKLYLANPDIDTPNAMKVLKGSGVKVTGQAVGRKLAALRSGPAPAPNSSPSPAENSDSESNSEDSAGE